MLLINKRYAWSVDPVRRTLACMTTFVLAFFARMEHASSDSAAQQFCTYTHMQSLQSSHINASLSSPLSVAANPVAVLPTQQTPVKYHT
jgi:hypothetical protein